MVEANGDVYPCDFYVSPERKLGSILTDTFPDLLRAVETSGFLSEAALHRSRQCAQCPNGDLCRGGCKRDWVYQGEEGRTRYCEALNRFFTENRGRLTQIARALN